ELELGRDVEDGRAADHVRRVIRERLDRAREDVRRRAAPAQGAARGLEVDLEAPLVPRDAPGARELIEHALEAERGPADLGLAERRELRDVRPARLRMAERGLDEAEDLGGGERPERHPARADLGGDVGELRVARALARDGHDEEPARALARGERRGERVEEG